jgi:GNAT superfamily N-acetyltransferase
MIIRKVCHKDLNSICRLGIQEFGDELWFTRQFLAETIKTPGYYYGAFDKGKLLGCILVRRFDRPKLWIFFMAVDKVARGKGIGSTLLKKVESKGCKSYPLLFVDVAPIRCSFYEKRGFRKIASVRDWFGIGKPGAVYSKRIA